MAEIKSTMDLIMEKTKGLTLSPKEKEEIRREEFLKKAKGWIRKFQDGWVAMDRVKGELFSKEAPSGWEKILQTEIIGTLEPEGDNEKRFQLMEELLNIPYKPFMEVMEAFNQRINQEKVRQSDHLIKQLAAKDISGPAIIPNLDRDPSWKRFYDQEKQACKEQMTGL